MARRQIDAVTIPDEILAELEQGDLSDRIDFDAIGKTLRASRDEAVQFRASHGIESTWALCEDAYNGIDDANRAEYAGAVWVKPQTMHTPLTSNDGRHGVQDRKSTAFVRLTSRYVDAGSAKIAEILLPIDDKAFSIKPTPQPTLIKGDGDKTPVVENGVALARPANPDEAASLPQGPPGSPPPNVNLTTHDLVQEHLAQAKDAAKGAETQIYDWMVECGHHHEMRKVIFDAARLGVGVLKGPVPSTRRKMALIDGALVIREDVVPIDKWVSAWNIYPDPACGETIRNGSYVWEKDHLSEKQVEALKQDRTYDRDQIEKVLLIGPTHTTGYTKNPNDQPDNKYPYEIWYYHGCMAREDFEAINPDAAKEVDPKHDKVHVVATMINDLVVKATTNPLQSGDLPYHTVPWIRRPGFWVGTGVAEQISVPQRIVTAATRSLLNNAGITSGPQIVINQKGIRPANGDWNLSPNKIWYLSEEGNTDDIRKAFLSFDISNVGRQLDAVIVYGMRLAEESTSIPLITQGMSGPTSPETLGATQLQNNNANQLLRYIGYSFDGHLTVPLVDQYYEYLLLDPAVPSAYKGDFSIDAHGSIALVERAIQTQFLASAMQIVGPNAAIFGANPKKLFREWCLGNHLDPDRVTNSPEEQAKIDNMPPPQPPAVQVAGIKAKMTEMQMKADQQRAQEEDALARELAQLQGQITIEAEKMRNETARIKVKLDTDRDTVYAQAEMSRAQADYTHNMALLQLKREIATADYASKHQLSLDQAKTKLADTAMRLQTQKELAAADMKLQVHTHHTPSVDALMKPPAQAPGKASNGKAFSQV